MLKSMTGFGRAQERLRDCTVSVSVSSVNSRFLEMKIILPDEIADAETEVRKLIQDRFYRGRVQVVVRLIPDEGIMRVDGQILSDYLKSLKEFVPEGIVPTVDLTNIHRLAGAFPGKEKEFTSDFLRVVSLALDEMADTRLREGNQIGKILIDLLNRLSELIAEAERLKEEENESRRRFVEENMAKLSLVDEEVRQRLFLEASWMVIKADVKEELERMRSHISAFREALDLEEPVGKRLEFLSQELHREATTLSSKSSCPKLVSLSVKLREIIEQIREQVRNVE
ncbi:MAG: YicC/YloC family endoribonuclease [candidate division WOR-3 bacterium]